MQSKHIGIAGIAKCSTPNMPHTVASELLCGNLARILFLPVPPSFIVQDNENLPHHVSLNFAVAGESLPPVDPIAVVSHDPILACGIVLFDIWIGNKDRHNGNMAFDAQTRTITLFDHSHAFLAGQDPTQWLNDNQDSIGIGNHCLVPHISNIKPFIAWNQKVSQIPEFFILEAVRECVKVGFPAELENVCASHLLERRKKLLDLIKRNSGLFRAANPSSFAEL